MAKRIKFKTRKDGPVSPHEFPPEVVEANIKNGSWFAADEKAGPTEQAAPQPTGRKSR